MSTSNQPVTRAATDAEVCTERRRHERAECARPCKVLHPASMRYMAARTIDLSSGGCLVEVTNIRPVHEGDLVELLVDWDRRGVVARDTTVQAKVVRAEAPDERRQRLGIAFLTEQALPVAA